MEVTYKVGGKKWLEFFEFVQLGDFLMDVDFPMVTRHFARIAILNAVVFHQSNVVIVALRADHVIHGLV